MKKIFKRHKELKISEHDYGGWEEYEMFPMKIKKRIFVSFFMYDNDGKTPHCHVHIWKIGDGRLKVNGKMGNVYYSECHAMDEYEYCLWKHKNLGLLTKSTKPYGKNLNNKYSDAIEFCTITTPSLKKYKNMTKLEVIKKLNPLGLILLLLDDGWFNPHSKLGNFCLSTGELNIQEIDALVDQYNKNGFINVHKIGIKRTDISFDSRNNSQIYHYIINYIPKDTDIIRKKFKYIKRMK